MTSAERVQCSISVIIFPVPRTGNQPQSSQQRRQLAIKTGGFGVSNALQRAKNISVMATFKCFAAVSLFLLILPAVVLSTDQCSQTENSYLWKVDVSPPVYIFGTLHLPYNTIWDHIPDNVKTAFSSSRDVYVELQLSNRETSDSLQECQLLPDDGTIDEFLPGELVTRIENYFEKLKRLLPSWLDEDSRPNLLRGGVSDSDQLFTAVTYEWKRKKPIWILTLISSLTEENIRQRKTPVLDRFFDNAARRLGKNLTALETFNDHCQPLNRLSNEQVKRVLGIELDYLESLPEGPPGTLERDLNEYRCGDLKGLIASQPILPIPLLSELANITNITSEDSLVIRQVETLLYNRLITRRNRRMTKTIDTLLRSQRTEPIFIAIGAGHLLATKNIIDRLQRKNYIVHHIATTDTIEGSTLPNNIVALGDPGSVSQSSSILDIPDQVNHHNSPQLPSLPYDVLESILREYNIGGDRKRRSSTADQIEQRDTDPEQIEQRDTDSDHIEQRDTDSDSDAPSSAHSYHNALLLPILTLLSILHFSRLH